MNSLLELATAVVDRESVAGRWVIVGFEVVDTRVLGRVGRISA